MVCVHNSGAGSSSQRRLAPSGSEGYDPDVEQVGCCTRGWTIALDEGFSKYSKAPVYVLILGILSMLVHTQPRLPTCAPPHTRPVTPPVYNSDS